MKLLRIFILSAAILLSTMAVSSAPRVLATAPARPSPQSPTSGALQTNYTPTLKWSNTLADHYEVVVSEDPGFSTTVEDDAFVTATSQTLGTTLDPATTYYWRVQAFSAAAETLGWSATANFRTAVLPPNLIAPADSTILVNNRPTFQWSTVANATGYNLQVSTTSLFSSTLVNVSVSYVYTQFTLTSDLPANATLYWRVRTLSSTYGPSAWSPGPIGNYFTITHTALQPSTPTLLQPVTNKLTFDTTPRLVWRPVTIPSATTFSSYEVQITTDSTFAGMDPLTIVCSPPTCIDDTSVTSQVVDTTTNTSYFDVPDPADALNPATTYYWRVRGINTDGVNSYNGDWSTINILKTTFMPVTLNTPADSTTLSFNRPQFSWTDPNTMPHTGYYRIQVSAYKNFSTLILDTYALTNPWTSNKVLPSNMTLYWRVAIWASQYAPSLWSPGPIGNYYTMVTANPPGVPILKLPASGALTTNLTPTFRWSIVNLPLTTTFGNYTIEVSTSTATNPDGSFATTVISDSSAINQYDPEFTPGSALSSATRYFWHVQACNTVPQCSAWSSMFTLRTAVDPPTLSTYSGGALTLPLDWNDVPFASGYTVQISMSPSFSTVIVNVPVTPSQYNLPSSSLPAHGTFYWRVRTNNPYFGPSMWSAVDSFTK